jgi:hypothetical protein
MTQHQLLDQLEADLRQTLDIIRTQVLPLSEAQLRRRPDGDPKRWNALECFDHLNRSSQDYLGVIEVAIHKAKARTWLTQPDAEVRYTWLGREAIRWVSPNAQPRRRKTSKRYNPLNTDISLNAVKSFIINTERLLRLLQQCRDIDINRSRVRFAILPVFKYRMGNLLEFMALHAARHTAQALRATA